MKSPPSGQGDANMTAATANTSIVRYLAVRTAAFVTLTAASSAFMALPYIG